MAELNAVDLLVREMMLKHPMLYPDRQKALMAVFFKSAYEWEDGGIVNRYPSEKTFEGPIDCSDLDSLVETLADRSFDPDRTAFQVAEIERQRRERLFRAENIDLYCRFSSRGEFGHFDYGDLDSYYFDSSYTALANAPYGEINPEWAAAIEEFVSDVLLAYNHVFNLHLDHDDKRKPEPSMFSRMPERFQTYYRAIEAVGEKIEAQTGTRARQAAWWAENGERIMSVIEDQ